MPPRPTTPTEDLYARLGVPRDASIEAIDLAWRGLLRRHHPDVAGADGLELAKRINVAHDWLSDPDLRRRYDRERRGGIRDGRPPRAGPSERDGRSAPIRTVRRPPTIEEQLAAVVERVGRLSRDELDRLALSEPAPIAFLATLRRFATGDAQATLDEAIKSALGALPATARRRPAIRDAVVGRLAEIVLGEALDDLLGESGGVRARERLARGWEAAVGQPRYGPATTVVEAFVERIQAMTPDEVRDLAGSGRGPLGPAPWPASTSPDEDEALRVSSELAGMDAAAAVPTVPAASATAASATAPARRAAARIAHLLVLRHAFGIAAFERAAGPWLGSLISAEPAVRPRVRHRP